MTVPHLTHIDADFSTLESWSAWCRAQDGGKRDARHDIKRPSTDATDLFGAVALLCMPFAFWGALSWALVWGRW